MKGIAPKGYILSLRHTVSVLMMRVVFCFCDNKTNHGTSLAAHTSSPCRHGRRSTLGGPADRPLSYYVCTTCRPRDLQHAPVGSARRRYKGSLRAQSPNTSYSMIPVRWPPCAMPDSAARRTTISHQAARYSRISLSATRTLSQPIRSSGGNSPKRLCRIFRL